MEREKAALAERKEEDLRLAEAGALASLFAHEVSNPLNSIRLGMRLLDGSANGPETKDLLATIRAESERMAASLEGFLAMSRGRGTGRDEIPPSLLHDVARNVEAQAALRRVRVEVRVGPGAPAVLGERPVLEQAFTSLVRNAVAAAPEGSAVEAVWTADSRGGALVSVEDHGPGFPPGERADLLRLGRSRREGGHGLGLPLAERFVTAHGGTLSLLDAEGGGARVEVRLPAASGKMPP
jgi:signal transduction histidine kinase